MLPVRALQTAAPKKARAASGKDSLGPAPQHGWYRIDEGGAVAYRHSRKMSDNSSHAIAPAGSLVQALKIEREWLQATNGLWLPKQYLYCVDGKRGFPMSLCASYRLVVLEEGRRRAPALKLVSCECVLGEGGQLTRYYRMPATFT